MIFPHPLFSVQKLTCGLIFCFCHLLDPFGTPSLHTSSFLYLSRPKWHRFVSCLLHHQSHHLSSSLVRFSSAHGSNKPVPLLRLSLSLPQSSPLFFFFLFLPSFHFLVGHFVEQFFVQALDCDFFLFFSVEIGKHRKYKIYYLNRI